MRWLWRTPAGLEQASWRALVRISLAAFLIAPVVGLLAYGLHTLLEGHSRISEWLIPPMLFLTFSFVASWAGYPICMLLARPILRQGYGGLLPIAGLGAVVGVGVFGAIFRPGLEGALLVGSVSGAMCMAVWWVCAATGARWFTAR